MIRHRLLVGTASNVAGKATALATWFVLTPFLLGRLGPAEYGLWVLAGSLASYGLLLDFGLAGAVAKYVAEHAARNDLRGAGIYIASAQRIYGALAILAAAIGFAVAPYVASWLSVDAEHARTAHLLTILTSLNVAVAIATAVPGSVLRGLQRYDLYNAVSVANSLVEAGAIVAGLLAGWGVVGLVAVFIPVNILTAVLSTWLARRTAPGLRLGWRGANLATMRMVANFSASIFAINLAARLQTRTDEFIIAIFRPLSAVTPYALARKLGEVAQLVALPFLKVVMPLASALNAADENERLRRLYVVASRIGLAIGAIFATVLVIAGSRILTLWVGEDYAQHGILVGILAVATLFATSQWPAVEMLQGMGRHHLVARTAVVSGIVNVGLSIVLLPSFGLVGVALGTLVPTSLASIGVVLPCAIRALRLPWGSVVRDIWAAALVPAAVAGLALWLLEHRTAAVSGAVFLMHVAIAVGIYAGAYLSMPAAAPERQLVSDILGAGGLRWRRVRPLPSPRG